jgi:FK506-binding protein 2
MRVLGFVAALIAATVVAATEPPTELEIKTTFLPEDCNLKAQTGDSIQVHYVCTQWTFNWNKI